MKRLSGHGHCHKTPALAISAHGAQRLSQSKARSLFDRLQRFVNDNVMRGGFGATQTASD
jgi:hypothetical protein